jgi:creatinine amidohydrolase
MVELAQLTWPDAETALAKAQLALLPVGSCEQHGPHMALESDIVIASGLARRLANDLGDLAVLCPAFGYGLSEHHMHFAGTVTLRPETFIGVVLDVVESLAHWDVRKVLVVNGHGGNIDALRLVSRSARRDLGSLVASVMWAQLAADEIASRASSKSYGHACEIETSVAMVLAPNCVYSERIEEPSGRATLDDLTDPPSTRVDQAIPFEEWTQDGALGDPRLADLETGQAIVDTVYERALEFARRFAEQRIPPRPGKPAAGESDA